MTSTSCKTSSPTSFDFMKPSSIDKRSNVSTSVNEPREIYRNCKNSFSEFLADPSEILVGTETEALFNCETSPNFSSDGKSLVNKYIFFTRRNFSSKHLDYNEGA